MLMILLAAIDYMHGRIFCKLNSLMQSLYPYGFITVIISEAGLGLESLGGEEKESPPPLLHPSRGTDVKVCR